MAKMNMPEPIYFDDADSIYGVVLLGVDLSKQTGTLVEDLSGRDAAARYAAAFRLRQLARSEGVDPSVANVARQVVLDRGDPLGLRRLAAEIFVIRGSKPKIRRRRW